MNYFISGGCKNGKSYFAQRVAQQMSRENGIPLYYLATMRPVDDEDRARIKRHLTEREGWGFTTIEQSTDILRCLDAGQNQDTGGCPGCGTKGAPEPKDAPNPQGAFLLDSVTALLSNEMFRADGTIDFNAPERVAEELVTFAKKTGNTVFVSDYIYSDAMLYDELTEAYRKGLAHIDRALAACCQRVAEVSFSNVTYFK